VCIVAGRLCVRPLLCFLDRDDQSSHDLLRDFLSVVRRK
jgi:hypothetical protein